MPWDPEYQSMTDNVTKANQIRVRVRTNDIPRWNLVLLKSGKKSNTALLEWMLQLAEEKLNLDPEQSRQEWDEALQRKSDGINGVPLDTNSQRDEDSGSESSKQLKRSGSDQEGKRDTQESGEGPLDNERLFNGSDHLVDDTTKTVDSLWLIETSNEQDDVLSSQEARAPNALQDRERGRNVEEHVESNRSLVPRVVEEQITVEKKGSNAPIRKRFRLRVSSMTSPSETVNEGAPQAFREPPKVRRKLEKNTSKAPSPLPAMSLRPRERNSTSVTATPAVGQLKPKRNSKNKVTSNSPATPDPTEGAVQVQENQDDSPAGSPIEDSSRPAKRLLRKRDVKVQKKGPFVCSHCPRVFNNATSHARHEKAHTKQNDHICNYCNKKFSTGGSLWHHKKSQHEEKHLKCPHCEERFAVERFLKLHMRRHTGEKPYKCKLCDARFTLASTLRNHQGTHSAQKPFLCDTCGVSFRRKDNLEHHIERRHKRVNLYSCNLCNKKFSVQSSLDNHKIHHQNKEHGLTPYKCDLCSKHFTTPNGLKSHTNLHKMKKDHVCETCGKVFKMRYYLTKHQAIHLKVKPFLCNICNRRFAQKSNLDIHMRTHTGVKPYACNICGKTFAHNVSLKGHTSTCHAESGSNMAVRAKPAKTAKETSAGKEPSRKKHKKNAGYRQNLKNQVPHIEVTNTNFGSEQININANIEIMNQPEPRDGENLIRNDPLAGRGGLEDHPSVAKETIPDALKDNLVIDEQATPHYSHTEDQSIPSELSSQMPGNYPASNHRASLVCLPEDVAYSIQTMMASNHNSDKSQYLTASATSIAREGSQSLPRQDQSIGQMNNMETPPTPPIHLENPIQSDLRTVGYSGVPHQVHHNHPGNIGVYTRHGHPLVPPSPLTQQTGAVSPIIHQDDNVATRTVEIHSATAADQSRLPQSLANPSPNDDLSPSIVPQPDPASPLPSNLQVENAFHQTQPSYSQNINFIPTFHPPPQPLTITAQSASLLPNMIRKEQPLLVENLMIPFRAIAPETAAQMVQDPRFNPPNSNLHTTNQPVHLPFRYVEYSQSPVQTSQLARPDSQPPPPGPTHFSKAQSNLPASRMTSSLQQSFAYTSSFATVANLEQGRGTPSYSTAQSQRSPIFVNATQIDSLKDVSEDGLGVEGSWKQQETRWEQPHLHQIPAAVAAAAAAQGNIPQQLHRQIFTDYPRKIIPLHTAVSSGSQQPMWDSPNS